MEQNTFESPLEDIFGIEKGTTVSQVQHRSPEVIEEADDGEEDVEIKTQLSTIYDYAIDAFEAQTSNVQSTDPRFAARNAEVAAQYLKIALDSTDSRAKNRHNKEKIRVARGKAGTPDTVNNNLIVADRNDILRQMMSIESDDD